MSNIYRTKYYSLFLSLCLSLSLLINIITSKRNITEENISQIFILKNIYETRNYFIQEINHNDLMSKKYKKVFAVLNYIEQLLILTSTVTRCVSISASDFLVSIPTDIPGST